jgi:hypothetical protein
MTTSTVWFTKKCLIAVALSTLAAHELERQFADVAKNPRAVQDKRVRMVAIADVMGDHFALYLPPVAKTADDLKRQIFVALRYNPRITSYDQYGGHLVEVTGVIDANRHGPFGGYACEIVAEQIRFVRQERNKSQETKSER